MPRRIKIDDIPTGAYDYAAQAQARARLAGMAKVVRPITRTGKSNPHNN